MNYQETLTYLFNSVPMFQNVGQSAYKDDLHNTLLLDAHLGHPHRQFKTIHIAGTNGKGSCSHTLASILQAAGYKVGLYTSPHLVDFRERIRVDGIPVPEDFVIRFVQNHRAFFEPLHPSFFELTTGMAFDYFAQSKVDVAVVEVGMGGRLDCTNIIHPDLSIITNISFDHMAFLGNTLAAIAGEKAGIIKEGTPVVIGEYTEETKPVFVRKALAMKAPIYFAQEVNPITTYRMEKNGHIRYETEKFGTIDGELGGSYQIPNTRTQLTAIPLLIESGYRIHEKAIKEGFAQVKERTGLLGRWQQIGDFPRVICDVGHNIGGLSYNVRQLLQQDYRQLHIVLGMVSDKDIDSVLKLLPTQARYYFTQASVKRALPADQLAQKAAAYALKGDSFSHVADATRIALQRATQDDLIYIGGSCFVVADLLAALQKGELSDRLYLR